MDDCSSAAEISCPFDAATLDELREILDGGEAITEVEQSPWPEQGRLGLQKPGHFVEQIGVAQRRVRMTLRLMNNDFFGSPIVQFGYQPHAENTLGVESSVSCRIDNQLYFSHRRLHLGGFPRGCFIFAGRQPAAQERHRDDEGRAVVRRLPA